MQKLSTADHGGNTDKIPSPGRKYSKSLINFKEVDRTFKNFMKVERKSYFRVIQWYTNYSESLMRKIVKKYGSVIIAVSVLREIKLRFFKNHELY
jgi:hypothetical protein